MLLGNYENFANVVAENIIKTRAFGLNDQCVSFTINFEFIDLAICKNKRKDYKIKVFRFFTKIKYALFSYRSSLCNLRIHNISEIRMQYSFIHFKCSFTR